VASEIRATQLEAIRRSRRYIYVENAYLTDDAFFYELVKARRRGVDVRVVVPLRSDQGQLTRENVLTANALFENGIRVYIYPGMSHLKAAVFDGWACLGSANLDQLSLRINKEVNVATSEPAAVDALVESLFERDFAISPEMEEVFAERWVDSLWELVGDYFF
jgi:cardiolipin synthase